jgi:septal ring factor EnvC (AmiA/AmiB activator)
MNQEELRESKEKDKLIKSLEAKLERRDKKIESCIRNENFLGGVISGLEDQLRQVESKAIVMNRKLTGIDREMLSQ